MTTLPGAQRDVHVGDIFVADLGADHSNSASGARRPAVELLPSARDPEADVIEFGRDLPPYVVGDGGLFLV